MVISVSPITSVNRSSHFMLDGHISSIPCSYYHPLGWKQCSRLKPSYELHFKGLSNFSPSAEGLVQIQVVNPRIQKWNTKLILNLCMNYMIYVSSTMWRVTNQPSNSISCSNNDPTLVDSCGGQIVSTTSFSIRSCVLKGCFERGIFSRANSHLKGIDDFNLEHCLEGVMSRRKEGRIGAKCES
jgi:hypothetical protein